jgi:endonuclease/exonuclease/phosphatase family metal-dependent hydrolase
MSRPRSRSLGAALVLAFASTLVPALAGAASMKVMSFNIRYDGGGFSSLTDPTGWLYTCGPRRDRVVNTILDEAPDIVGVQEALYNQVLDIQAKLPGYAFYGVGRNDGNTLGEFSGLWYRSDRFTRFDQGTFWLSDTPDVPGTVFPCSGSIRIASWMKVHDSVSGADYFVLDTHWDNSCQDSREKSAVLVRQKIKDLSGGLPVIALGDLNTGESSLAVSTLRGVGDPTGFQLADSYREVFPVASPDEATFHGWDGGVAGSRIDFLLHTADFTPTAAAIVHTGFTCGYPSDHFPVTATFTTPGTPSAAAEHASASAAPAPALVDPCIPNCTGCGANVAPASRSAASPWGWLAATGAFAAVLGARVRSARRRLVP